MSERAGPERLSEVVDDIVDRVTQIEEAYENFTDNFSRLWDAVREIRHELRTLDNRVKTLEAATQGRDDGKPSKAGIARNLAMTQAVKLAVLETNGTKGGGVRIKDVQNMARPDWEIQWTTVDRQFKRLDQEYECFWIANDEEYPSTSPPGISRGYEDYSKEKALRTHKDAVPDKVVREVATFIQDEQVQQQLLDEVDE